LEDGIGAPQYDNPDDLDQLVASLTLKVTYPDTYPDILPELELTPSGACALDDEDLTELTTELNTLGEENLGMAMVFTLASQLKDSTLALIARKAEKKEREAEARLMQSIQADESKFIGTKLTVENFLEWKLKFDAERDGLSTGTHQSGFRKFDKKKLTGRRLFEKDAKLAQSDMSFLEEGEEVDTTQFERVRLNNRDLPGEDNNDDSTTSVLDLLRSDQD